MVLKAPLSVGVSVVGGGGVGLDSSAQVLSDLALGSGCPTSPTVRKLTRRLGADTVNELTRVLIVQATRSKRFRPRAVRIDSDGDRGGREVSDRRGPRGTWCARARAGRSEAREAGQGAETAGAGSLTVDGSQLRGITRTSVVAQGKRKSEVLKLTARTGSVETRSPETRAAVVIARRGRVPGRESEAQGAARLRARGPLREGSPSDQAAVGASRSPTGWLSLADPDARPIPQKESSGKPNEFWLCEPACKVTENTRVGRVD